MLPTGEHKEAFLNLVRELCSAIRGKPLNDDLETYLNQHYGADSESYQKLSSLMQIGVEEGWVAYSEIEGAEYRRGRILEPGFDSAGMSVESGLLNNVKGQYHCHTTGEINMVIPLEQGANFCGAGAGWVVYPPLSEHFPTVHARALILFFLPDGKIEYKAPPSSLVGN